MPSRRELRDQYPPPNSQSVFDKAMAILRWKGLTDTLEGVGVFVRDPLPRE